MKPVSLNEGMAMGILSSLLLFVLLIVAGGAAVAFFLFGKKDRGN